MPRIGDDDGDGDGGAIYGDPDLDLEDIYTSLEDADPLLLEDLQVNNENNNNDVISNP